MYAVLQYVEGILMAILDLLTGTSRLPRGPEARIAVSARPAALVQWTVGQAQHNWDNYINTWTHTMNYFHDDQQNAAAIKKRFFLVVDEAYLAEIKNPRTGFCGLNIRDITSFLKTEYPPEPEDQRIV